MRQAVILGLQTPKTNLTAAQWEGEAELSRCALCACGQIEHVSRLAVCFTMCTKHPAENAQSTLQELYPSLHVLISRTLHPPHCARLAGP